MANTPTDIFTIAEEEEKTNVECNNECSYKSLIYDL